MKTSINVDKDFNEIHFVEKNKGLLALSANLLKYELLDTELFISEIAIREDFCQRSF